MDERGKGLVRIGEVLGQSGHLKATPAPIIYEEPEPPKLNYSTFAEFKHNSGSEKALALFKELAFGKAKWFMLLCYGSKGCGKTHLCQASSVELQKQGKYIIVLEWERMVSVLKGCFDSETKDAYNAQFNRYCKADRLIIDDVGMGTTGSQWEWGVFDSLINYRYDKGLLTVCTTNLDITELPDRSVSRFRDAIKSRVVLNTAQDYRPKKEANK